MRGFLWGVFRQPFGDENRRGADVSYQKPPLDGVVHSVLSYSTQLAFGFLASLNLIEVLVEPVKSCWPWQTKRPRKIIVEAS